MDKAIIYDLDGTLIDVNERLKKSMEEVGVEGDLREASDEEYNEVMSIFNSKKYIDLDKPKENVIKQFNKEGEENYAIIMTGRPKSMDKITKKQLDNFDISYDEIIYVNENFIDIETTAEAKKEAVKELQKQYEIVKFVDDMEENRTAVAEVIGEDKVFAPEKSEVEQTEQMSEKGREIKREITEETKESENKTPEQEITEYALGLKK